MDRYGDDWAPDGDEWAPDTPEPSAADGPEPDGSQGAREWSGWGQSDWGEVAERSGMVANWFDIVAESELGWRRQQRRHAGA